MKLLKQRFKFLLIFLFISCISNAQIIDDIGINGGISISDIKEESNLTLIQEYNPSFTFSPSIFFISGLKENISIVSEFGFLKKGGLRYFSLVADGVDDYTPVNYTVKRYYHFITTSFKLKYTIDKNNLFLYGAIGPRFDIYIANFDFVNTLNLGLNTSIGLGYRIGRFAVQTEFTKLLNFNKLADCTYTDGDIVKVTDNTMLLTIGVSYKIKNSENINE